MAYKQQNLGPAGWQAAGQPQPGLGDGNMWRPSYMSHAPNFPHYQQQLQQQSRNGLINHQMMGGGPGLSGMMGPPPVPKQHPISGVGSMARSTPPQFTQHMMPGSGMGFPPEFVRNGLHNDQRSSHVMRHNGFPDSFNKLSHSQSNQVVGHGMLPADNLRNNSGWQGNPGINGMHLPMATSQHVNNPLDSNDTTTATSSFTDDKGTDLLDDEVDTKALEAKLQEILDSSSAVSSTRSSNINHWSQDGKATAANHPVINNHFNHMSKPAPAEANVLHNPSTPSDLRHIQQLQYHPAATAATRNTPPGMPNLHQATHQAPAAADAAYGPGMLPMGQREANQALPSMGSPTVQQAPNSLQFTGMGGSGTAMSAPSTPAPSSSDKDKPKRRRRKRCGECDPCQLREDCGTCYVCRNKGQVNAICKARKCLVLRKKAAGSESGSSDATSCSSISNITHQSDPVIRPLSAHGMQQVPAQGASTHHDLQQQMMPPHGIPTSIGSNSSAANSSLPPQKQLLSMHSNSGSPMSSNGQHQPLQQMRSQQSQPPMFYPSSNKFFQSDNPSVLSNQELPQHSNPPRHDQQQHLNIRSSSAQHNNSLNSSSHSINNLAEKLPNFLPNRLLNHKSDAPFSNSHSASQKFVPASVSGIQQAPVPNATSNRFSSKSAALDSSFATAQPPATNSDKYNDLYSTFKDDMQKMIERTYIRANGVKVCKTMAKFLTLNITDEELRSSQPPKPLNNPFELLYPDTKPQDLPPVSSSESLISPTTSQAKFIPHSASSEALVQCLPSNTQSQISDISCSRKERIPSQEQDAPQSHGTTSDLEDTAHTLDSHNGVDSGFSSSSPADRQSPSPKVRFELPTPEEEKLVNSALETSMAPTTGMSGLLKSSGKSMTNLSSLLPENGEAGEQDILNHGEEKMDTQDSLEIKQEVLDRSYEEELKKNSIQNVFQPANSMAADILNQSVAIQSSTAGDKNTDSEMTSIQSVLDSLTATITGQHDMKTDDMIKQPTDPLERSDPAYLLKHNKIAEPPNCGCVNRPYDENIDGPYYVHLGTAESVPSIRRLMEERTGYSGSAIRVEKVRYTTKEGRTSLGCPAAKWIVRRSGEDEKVLVIAKHRVGHNCATAWIIVSIVVWEGVPSMAANHMYDYLTRTLPVYGYETERRCGTNQPRDCACQGWDTNRKGASFSFGCSWSVYYNGCKFARSHVPRKFKLRDETFEGVIESKFQALGEHLAPLYKQIAPMSYGAQVRYEKIAGDCRIGFRAGRPFSGCTATVDFCAHQHRDTHNMNNGCTVVVTLTKHRGLSKPDDEQLHTLPMYVVDDTDEFGSREGLIQKINDGSIDVLDKFSQEQRRRSRPYKRKKKGTETYQSPKVKAAFIQSVKEKMTETTQTSAVQAAKHNLFNTSTQQFNHPKEQFNTQSFGNQGPPTSVSSQLPPIHADKSADTPGSRQHGKAGDDDECILMPKPRPPSPEYDDPECKEVHEDNTHLFKDPNVGGVAIALTHGSVLFEVAKRELHATTALKQPDRYNPTRISLVFYQHKRLNYKKHGFFEYQKAEEERQRARKEAKAKGIEYIPKGLKYKQKRQKEAALRKNKFLDSSMMPKTCGMIRKKPGRKFGWKQKKQLRFAAYQYLWPKEFKVNHPDSSTINSVVTRWMKPECIVTGPYQRWISLHTPPNPSSRQGPQAVDVSASEQKFTPPSSSPAQLSVSKGITSPVISTASFTDSAPTMAPGNSSPMQSMLLVSSSSLSTHILPAVTNATTSSARFNPGFNHPMNNRLPASSTSNVNEMTVTMSSSQSRNHTPNLTALMSLENSMTASLHSNPTMMDQSAVESTIPINHASSTIPEFSQFHSSVDPQSTEMRSSLTAIK